MADDEELEELPSLDDLRQSMDDLKTLHQLRGKISLQLGSLATKQEVRRQIVEHLYEVFELVAEDLDALAKDEVDDPFAVREISQGFEEHLPYLERVLAKAREKLMLPIQVTEGQRIFEQIVDHDIYATNAQMRIVRSRNLDVD